MLNFFVNVSGEQTTCEIKVTSSIVEVVSSILDNVELEAESPAIIEEIPVTVSDIQPHVNSSEDIFPIFTNSDSSSNLVPGFDFETMFNNESFSELKSGNELSSSHQFLESSSDEEMDQIFKVRVHFSRSNFMNIPSQIEAAQARTELINPTEGPSTLPVSSSENDTLENSSAPPSCDSEIEITVMESDFSDSVSESSSILSLFRRVPRPLSLRYSSEDVDPDSPRMLNRVNSFMNFLTRRDGEAAEGCGLSRTRPVVQTENNSFSTLLDEPSTSSSVDPKEEFQTLFSKSGNYQFPSCSIQSSERNPIEFPLKPKLPGSRPLYPSNISYLKKKISAKAKLFFKSWWKRMVENLSSEESMDEDEDEDEELDSCEDD